MRGDEIRTLLTSRNSRMSLVAIAMALLMVGMAVFKNSFPDHKSNLDPMESELRSHMVNQKKAAESSKKLYKLPPPIKYYNGTGEFCTHNSQSEDCCSEEHCATIVSRSTLYSECCGNIHNSEPNSRSKIFPLLITSAPRSGTWFMQQLFTKTGLHGLTIDDMTPEHTGTVSWKHVFSQDGYYFGRTSVTHLYRSKFRMIWHLVRDPLHALTSLAFTDPLWEDTDHSKIFMGYIASHVPMTNRSALLQKFDISPTELEDVLAHRSMETENRNVKLDNFLIWRGLEIYLYWHGFINHLNVPIFRIEDLAIKKNLTVLDEIFKSVDLPPPNHDKVKAILNAQEAAHHKRRLRQTLHQGSRRLQNAYARTKRIRKGSRIHRSQLTWDELCRVSEVKAKAFLKMSHSFGYYLDISLDSLCEE